jgi:S-adenosylmethionine-diacylgycerolhomoserine-N-methlytransferase
MSAAAKTHAALMDEVYRRQRYIYDATRKYFLLGRDGLIDALDPAPGDAVLEIGCGTGRNLAVAARRYPKVRFHGLDISAQMLETAAKRVTRVGMADRIALAQADATDFDPVALFGVERFERVYFSYTLSMIPDWRAALDQALAVTAPQGRLHIVDFGQQNALPRLVRKTLRAWLSLFHVDPQAALADGFRDAAGRAGDRPTRFKSLYRDYAWALTAGPARRRV